MIDFVPVNERIVVIPKKADEQVKGLYVPSSARAKEEEKPEVGYVVAVDSVIKEPKCKVGDKIIFNRYGVSCDITPSDGKRYLIMLETSILAIYTNISEEEKESIKKIME